MFAEIAAPPMNLLGTELVRDLVSLIQRAEADDEIHVVVFASADPDYFAIALAPADEFRRDSDLFLECARNPETQRRMSVAMARGFQTRDGEMALGMMVNDLADR